jgi:hypothetical protein
LLHPHDQEEAAARKKQLQELAAEQQGMMAKDKVGH